MIINKFKLTISSYHSKITLEFCKFILFLLDHYNLLDLKITILTLPKEIKKYTFLKSPHIYKTARIQLESRQVKTVLTITNFTKKSNLNCLNIIKHFVKTIPIGIKLNIKKTQLCYV